MGSDKKVTDAREVFLLAFSCLALHRDRQSSRCPRNRSWGIEPGGRWGWCAHGQCGRGSPPAAWKSRPAALSCFVEEPEYQCWSRGLQNRSIVCGNWVVLYRVRVCILQHAGSSGMTVYVTHEDIISNMHCAHAHKLKNFKNVNCSLMMINV